MGQLRCQVCKRFLGTLNGLQYCRKCDLHYPTGSRCFCGRNLDYPKVLGSSTITICRCGARHRYLGLGSEESTGADA